MVTIANTEKWERNKKIWWNIYGIHNGSKTLLAKVNSKGLAYMATKTFSEIYEEVIIE